MLRKIALLAILLVIVAAAAFMLSQRREPAVSASGILGSSPAVESAGFARATGPQPLTFPADYGPHPDYQTEWWYYTGNLDDADGHHFGYQFTIFRRAALPPDQRADRASDWTADQIYMGHFALTDVAGQNYQAFEHLARGGAGLAGAQAEPYKVWLEDWQVEEISPGVTRLQAAAGDVAIDLTLTDLKGPVLHGDHGYSQKGPDPGNASYYYSLTRLASEGTVTVGDRAVPVQGLSWQDHEFSTSALAADQVGWDWFALQLDDDSELKVFHIRKDDGSVDPFSAGSFIAPDGTLTPLSHDDFTITVNDTWRSPRTGAEYPASWTVTVPSQGIRLDIEPYLADQELNVSYSYWEGAVRFSGEHNGVPVTGDGYVELTGYAGSMQGQF